MNCGQAKTEVALWAGDDLDEQATGSLERHLAVCPECREYRQRMADSLRILHERSAPVADRYETVWPKVDARLAVQSHRDQRRAERLNRWLPAAAAVAACLAVIALTSEPEPRRQDVYGQPLPSDGLAAWETLRPAEQVAFPHDLNQRQQPGNPAAWWPLDSKGKATGWPQRGEIPYHDRLLIRSSSRRN